MSAIAALLNYGTQFGGQALSHKYNKELTSITNQANKELQDSANSTNIQIARETNQANKELSELAYHQNIEQWNRENEYNSPAAQMARYKEAGLNPNLVYSQSNMSASSPTMSYHPQTSASVQAPKMVAPSPANFSASFGGFDILKDIYDMSTMADKMEQSRSQTEIMRHQAEISKSMAKMQSLESDFKLSQLTDMQEQTKATINKIGIESDRLLQDIANGEVSRSEALKRIDRINSEIGKIQQEERNLRKTNKLLDAQISNYNADIDLKKQSYSHNQIMNPLLQSSKRIENAMKEFDEVLKEKDYGIQSKKGTGWLMLREAIQDFTPFRFFK